VTSHRRARRGFTLWEMAMVLVILAVLTSVAVPAFVKFGDDRTRTGTDLMLDLLNDTRRTAVRHNVMATLIIDPESGHYRVDTVGANGLGLVREDSIDFAMGDRLETELPRLRYIFRSTGAAFGDTVVLRGADSTRIITVDRCSGDASARAR
jgi:prepilin-type N-terminal cleavage/methylation domain-containing protein